MQKLETMLREIALEVERTAAVTGREHLDARVLAALRSVPRHEFVPPASLPCAYDNEPLPIGHGQTISQPYIVALMTDLLDLRGDEEVLEIGTGCGYQTAILAQLAKRVYSVEIIPELSEATAVRLRGLGCRNVELRVGDGNRGWPEHAPFDAIIVTAAAPRVPPRLVEQLKPGGRMVLPLARAFFGQDLILVEKDTQDAITTTSILPVSFVPLTGGDR
jgi:protein-L-isoaspartate(D-aspartate) O-methyltransferase